MGKKVYHFPYNTCMWPLAHGSALQRSRGRGRRRGRTLILALLCASAHAQVLHERVNVGLRCANGVCYRLASQKTTLPDAIQQDGELLRAPTGGVQPNSEEQVYTP